MSTAPQFPPDYRSPELVPPPVHSARWKRLLAWLGIIVLVLIVAIIAVIYVLLHSDGGRRYVLGKAEQKLTAALGNQVQVRDFRLTFSGISPALDLYAVTILGAQPHPTPPLLEVNHVAASLQITSLLRRAWYVNDVTVDHPVLHVLVDSSGRSNLPQVKNSNKGQNKINIFDLGIRHALLDKGEIFYNNRKSVLSADLHDLTFRAAFDPAQQMYSGSLNYRDGKLEMGSYKPVPHNFDTRFRATRQVFMLDRAVLSSGHSQFSVKATLEDYAQPRITGQYSGLLDAGEIGRVLNNPAVPAGTVHLAGSIQYASRSNMPMLSAIVVNGDLTSSALAVNTPSFRGEISNIGGQYSVVDGNFRLTGLHANLLGGHVTGNVAMLNMAGANPRSQLRAELSGVSLADLRSTTSSSALKQVTLGGTLNADADASWGKNLESLVARTNAALNARLSPSHGGGAAIPLTGEIHAHYAAAAKQLTVSNSYMRMPQTSLGLEGTVSERSALKLQLQSRDLHELETIADILQPPAPAAAPLDLYGTASFSGSVRGSTSTPQITGQLNGQNIRLRNTAWRVLRSEINITPSQVSVQNGLLQPADRGRLTFSATAGTRKWSLTKDSPLQLSVHASNLNVSNFAQVAGSHRPVSGTLAADIALHGSQLNPVGQGNVSLTNAKISGESINSLNARFDGTGNEVHTTVELRMPAGTAQSTATLFPKTKAYQATLRADGIRLEQLETLKQRNLQLTGLLNANASGQGTFDNPQLTATLSTPQLRIQGEAINALTLQANVSNHVVNVALDSEAMNTTLRARANVQLTGQYVANASLDTQAIPLAPLVAMFAPSQAGSMAGQTELHATLHGPLKDKGLLHAHAVLPVLRVSYKNTVQIGAANPIQLDYVNGVLNLQRTMISGTDTSVQVQGSLPVVDRSKPVSLLLLGNVNLQLAQLFSPDLASSGQLQFNINSYGQRADPNVEGQIRIVNAAFATGGSPIGLQNGNGVLTLTKDRLNITQFRGSVGGGTVTARGGVLYRPQLRFELALAGNNVRMLYPDGVREGFDLNLALAGTPQDAELNGRVSLTDLSFTPTFDLQELMGSFGGTTSVPPSQSLADNLKLNLTVQSTSQVSLVSRELSLQAAANLRVQGTANQPVVLGRIDINGGDLIFQGNRYVLNSGFIDFVSPARTEPVLNVRVDTTIQQYDIHIMFRGPVDHLQTSYTSDPSLPPPDIIHLVAFGSTSEAAAANPTPPGALGAESLIASQVSSQITSRVSKIAGISQLSVDPVLQGSNQQNPGARVTIQQRVTGNIFVTFSTDVTSTQNQIIQLQYKLTPRLSFSGTRDQNGGFGFDTKIRKTW